MKPKLFISLCLFLSLMLSTVPLRADWGFEDEVGSKVIETLVSTKEMSASLWRGEDEHPPLTPRKAIKLAKDEVKRLSPKLDLKKSELVFSKLCLEPHGPSEQSWVWVVEFGRIEGAAIDYGETWRVVVLMTGEVITPKIRDAEK